MCYAIPGKIIDIDSSVVTLEYFGERKKARNEFYSLNPGDYVYAQGGIVIQKIDEKDAIPILETWQELFFKLKETDLRLARESKTLYGTANSLRSKNLGNSTCVHGILEFSNFCRNDCLYCGLRKSNTRLKRYRMTREEIIGAITDANEKGFKALVLQSGEDLEYDDEMLAGIIREVRSRFPMLLVLSIGERGMNSYQKLYESGARGVLLRFETANENLYRRMRPGYILQKRIELIRNLRKMGFLIFTGFLMGLPGEKDGDILKNIELTGELCTEMFSFGPFIPHPDTPLAKNPSPSVEKVLDAIARARILYNDSKILVTTAMETLDKDGAKKGMLAGANSLMIDITPGKYRRLYEIYPNRAGTEIALKDRIDRVLELLYSLGRAPTDLGL